MICRYCRQSVVDAPFCCLCGKRQEILRTGKKRGNGQGTALKRGKTWTGIRPGYRFIDDEGYHRVRPSKGGFATKKEALEWASSSVEIRDGSPKLIELWEQYKTSELPKLSANRQSAYKTARKKLEPLMGRQIHTLTLAELQDLINEKCPTFYTARDVKTILKAMYKRAMVDSIIQKNIADFIVRRNSYAVSSSYIAGFGRPNWSIFSNNSAPSVSAGENATKPSAPSVPKVKTCSVTLNLPVIEYGDASMWVKLMQTALIGRGFNCGWYGADGEYGQQTKIALYEFQKKNSLETDNICGQATWKKLLEV